MEYAAIYIDARIVETQLDNQIELHKEVARLIKCQVPRKYIFLDLQGGIDENPILTELAELAESGHITAIITQDPERICDRIPGLKLYHWFLHHEEYYVLKVVQSKIKSI